MAVSPNAAASIEPLVGDADFTEDGLGEEYDVGPAPVPPHAERRRRLALSGMAALATVGAIATLVGNGGPPPRATLTAAASDPSSALQLVEGRKPPWQCSINGDDCSQTQCCSQPGSQCYRKNQFWASCNQTCTPGVMPGDEGGGAWSCTPIGVRAPPPCSWEGDTCKTSGCCKRIGFKCYEKDETWASCAPTCGNLSQVDPEPWTCKVLGGDLGTHVFQKSSSPAGTSLYCFAVVTPDGVTAPGVEAGYESSIMKMLKEQKLGIYQCDASDVFQGVRVSKGDWSSVVNTDIFLHVWRQVQAKAVYKKFDWTIKVDVDAVFFPDRMKAHLVGMGPPANTPVYLHNIKFRYHFMGALEVLSAKAVDVMLTNFEECAKNLGHNGGEDYFTMQCLDANGVGHMTDFSLLDDKYQHGAGWHLFDINPCTNPAIVAFHPYKHENSWQGCYKVAMGINKPEDFVGCTERWHGDACSLTSTRQHLGTDPQPSTGIVGGK